MHQLHENLYQNVTLVAFSRHKNRSNTERYKMNESMNEWKIINVSHFFFLTANHRTLLTFETLPSRKKKA